jgi:lambda family phage minor tail protein L
MRTEGWETRATGTTPTPSVTFANVNAAFSELNASYDDLRGKLFTRWRVFRKFLDGQPDADPDEHYPPDIYRIEQKTKQNLLIVSFDLSSSLDQQDVKVPGRQILRQCQFRYRDWNQSQGAFDYSELVTCQYDGESMFDAQGNPVTDPQADVCGHNFDDCVLRMGGNAGDIFGGFPGAGALQGR